MNVAEKVFRKVKTETSMPEEDLELSLDNVDKGELFTEAQSMSRTQLKQMVSHLLLIWYFHEDGDQDQHHGCPQYQWYRHHVALQDQARIKGGCQDGWATTSST